MKLDYDKNIKYSILLTLSDNLKFGFIPLWPVYNI